MVAMLYLHPTCAPAIRRNEYLLVDPSTPISEYIDGFGNRCGRFTSPPGRIRLWNDAVLEDSGEPDRQNIGAAQLPIEALPDDAIEFLIASRYCEVDRMT